MHAEGKPAGVAIPSDALRNFLDLRNECAGLRAFLAEIIQVVIVLDASAVQAELRWRLGSRTKPTARTSLHEAIESGAVSAVAPIFLKEEIEKYISLIATEIGVTDELVEAEWRLIQRLIVFYKPIGPPSRFALVDPKDADYALTASELEADFVRTNDAHFAKMGLPVIGPELDAVLRDYARSTSVVVTFKVGSAFVVSIGVEAFVEALRAIAAGIRSLPPAVKLLLALAIGIAVLQGRASLARSSRDPLQRRWAAHTHWRGKMGAFWNRSFSRRIRKATPNPAMRMNSLYGSRIAPSESDDG